MQGELSARIIYFFTDSTNRDVDNIIKPILDALKGLVFVDDNIIFEVTARKTQKVAGLTIKGAPSCLVGALDVFSDFVFVRIEEGPNHTGAAIVSTERSMETKLLRSLQPRYEREGFRFVIDPDADALPPLLRQYHPDAIARRAAGEGGIVIGISEIKGPAQKARNLEQLAREVAKHKEWRLDIVLADRALQEAWLLVPSLEELESEFRALESDFAKLAAGEDSIGDLKFQLLFGWPLFEAAGRRVLLENDIDLPKDALNSKGVIENLVLEGLMSDDDAAKAVDLMRLRNLITHGYLKQPISADDVRTLFLLIEKLLRGGAPGFHES